MKEVGEKSLQAVRDLYEQSLQDHGVSSNAVGWRDADSHRCRFDMLTKLFEGDGPFSVSDLGCGYGAYLGYLQNLSMPISRFRGFDISQRMLSEAAQQYPNGEWVLGSTLDAETDYVLASGIFNVRLEESEESWQIFIERTLDDMNAHSKKGFAFNLLSTYVDFRNAGLYYGNPSYFFDLCKRRYSRRVALIHDYPLYEWTIIVRK